MDKKDISLIPVYLNRRHIWSNLDRPNIELDWPKRIWHGSNLIFSVAKYNVWFHLILKSCWNNKEIHLSSVLQFQNLHRDFLKFLSIKIQTSYRLRIYSALRVTSTGRQGRCRTRTKGPEIYIKAYGYPLKFSTNFDRKIFDLYSDQLIITCQTEILVHFERIENELKFQFLEYAIIWPISNEYFLHLNFILPYLFKSIAGWFLPMV